MVLSHNQEYLAIWHLLGPVRAELEEFYTTYYNFTRFDIPDFYNNSYTSNCKTLDPIVIIGHLVLHIEY